MNIDMAPYLIRTVQPEDQFALFDLISRNRPRLEKYLPITLQETASLELTGPYILRRMRDAESQINFTNVIAENANLVGMLFVKEIDSDAGSCELGYFVDSRCEGQGIITKAVKATIQHCHDHLGLQRFIIKTGQDNPGSIQVATKNGFQKTETIYGGHKDFDGNPVDIEKFELILQSAQP